MVNHERQLVVSTDSSGMFGTPNHWQDVWGFAKEDSRFAGFEMLGWGGRMRFWTDFLIENAEKTGCNIVGIHGRTGGLHDAYSFSHRVVLGTLNNLLIPTPELVTRYGSQVSYILVHGPELRLHPNRVAIHENRYKIRQLCIENHIRPGAVGSALELVRELRFDGVNAALTFDLFHYASAHDHRPRGNGFAEVWRETMRTVDWILKETDANGEPIPVKFHIPMGLNPEDSLPISEINDNMWCEFGDRLDGHPGLQVVIENQQQGRDLLRTTPRSRAAQRDRNKILVDTLTDARIIK